MPKGKWIIASHNVGKVREIGEWLSQFDITAESASTLGLASPEETGNTFEANALLKARAASHACSLPCLADDSGVVVPALDGAPGIYTAGWAETEDGSRNWDLAMRRVHKELEQTSANDKMRAAFVCSLAWVDGDTSVCVRGEAWGHLVWPIRGKLGFGFEPMFRPDGEEHTYGQMTAERRAKINHRATAFTLLQQELGLTTT